MKRCVCAILLAVLMCGVLVGCESQKSTQDKLNDAIADTFDGAGEAIEEYQEKLESAESIF